MGRAAAVSGPVRGRLRLGSEPGAAPARYLSAAVPSHAPGTAGLIDTLAHAFLEIQSGQGRAGQCVGPRRVSDDGPAHRVPVQHRVSLACKRWD